MWFRFCLWQTARFKLHASWWMLFGRCCYGGVIVNKYDITWTFCGSIILRSSLYFYFLLLYFFLLCNIIFFILFIWLVFKLFDSVLSFCSMWWLYWKDQYPYLLVGMSSQRLMVNWCPLVVWALMWTRNLVPPLLQFLKPSCLCQSRDSSWSFTTPRQVSSIETSPQKKGVTLQSLIPFFLFV